MKLPSFDMSNPENIKSAQQADSPTGVSGKYVAEIAEATIEESKNGSVFIKLAFKMPNNKIYRQEPKHIMYEDGREGFYAPKLKTVFGITGASDKLGTDKVKDGEFVDGAWIEKEVEVPSYVGLLGKKIGVVLNYYKEYPRSYGINGYTNRPIPTKSEDEAAYMAAKNDPTTIWMPNYEKDAQSVYDFVLFFNPETEKTFSEMLDDNLTEPKAVQEALDKVLAKNHSAVVLEGKEWDDLRVKLLKASLKKAGMPFDKSMFIDSTVSPDTNATNDLP